MATFGELKSYISDDLERPDITDARLGRAVNDAIGFFQNERTWFNEALVTLTLTVGNPVVPNVPSDFLYEIPEEGLVIPYAQISYRLRKLHPAEYDDVSVQSTGLPFGYMNQDKVLSVYYWPDQAYSLSLYYVKGYSALVNSGDTNDWTVNAPDLIQAKATENLYRYKVKDFERADGLLPDIQRYWGSIRDTTTSKLATGSLMTENLIARGGLIYGQLNSW